jgi:predicted transcriptional regulator
MLHEVAVKDFMSASLITFKQDMPVLDAIQQLVELRISGAPVVDNLGNLVGMLSEKDCLKVALDTGYYEELGGSVSEYMTAKVETVETTSSILELARLFLETPFKRFPVLGEDNTLVGQISRADVLRAIIKIRT